MEEDSKKMEEVDSMEVCDPLSAFAVLGNATGNAEFSGRMRRKGSDTQIHGSGERWNFSGDVDFRGGEVVDQGRSFSGPSDAQVHSIDGKDTGGMDMGGRRDIGGIDMGGRQNIGGIDMGGGQDIGGIDMGGRRDTGGIDMGGRQNIGGIDMGGRKDTGGSPSKKYGTDKYDNGGGYNDMRNDFGGDDYKKRNDFGGEDYKRRNEFGGDNYKRGNDFGGGDYSRRNDFGGDDYKTRNDFGGEDYKRRNDFGGDDYKTRNDFGGDDYNSSGQNIRSPQHKEVPAGEEPEEITRNDEAANPENNGWFSSLGRVFNRPVFFGMLRKMYTSDAEATEEMRRKMVEAAQNNEAFNHSISREFEGEATGTSYKLKSTRSMKITPRRQGWFY